MSEDKKPKRYNYEFKSITLQRANNRPQTSGASDNNDYVKMYNTFKAYLEASKVFEELKQENARLREALEFYASYKNWLFRHGFMGSGHYTQIRDDDVNSLEKDPRNHIMTGGRRAREALGVK